MRARDIVGRRIVRLHQERLPAEDINSGNDGAGTAAARRPTETAEAVNPGG
jgi:hypothetical protein